MFIGISMIIALGWPAKASLDPSRPIGSFIHQSWQTAQGLPQNSVLAIAQTRDGYIWLGTEEGLARFDGVRFTTFGTREGLPNKIVTSLIAEKTGDLWVGTNGGGIAHYQNGRFHVYSTKNGLPNDSVLALHEDQRGELWIGTQGGGLVHFENEHFHVYTKMDGLADNAVFAIAEDPDGKLWIGTHDGLSTFTNGQIDKPAFDHELGNRNIRTVLVDRERNVWVGTENGLYRAAVTGKIQGFQVKDGLPSSSIYSLIQDGSGSVWVGTASAGLARYAGGRFSIAEKESALTGVHVWSLFEDREGNLLAGTAGGGLHCFRQGAFSTISASDGLPADAILGVFEDSHGGSWFGSDKGLIHREMDGHTTLYTPRDGLPDPLVFSIAEDRSGVIWIGTRRGLCKFAGGRITSYMGQNGPPPGMVVTEFVDRDGILWLGSRGGLTRYDGQQFTTYTTKDGLSNDFVLAITQSKDGALWIGTGGGGADRFAGGHFTPYRVKNGLSSDVVRAVYADFDGTLWFGTNGGGLSRLRNGKITKITIAEGLYDDDLFAIADDNRGHLWITCNRGIFSLSKQQIQELAAGLIKGITPAVYGTSEGLKTRECNGGFQPAAWRYRDGRLMFPTMQGVAIVDPARVAAGTKIGAVIERVVIDGKDYALDQAIQSPPGRGQLEFEFTAPALAAADSVQFRYMLEGFDKDWVSAGSRRAAYYTNIPHGHYRFLVKAGVAGNWRDDGPLVMFTLEPHFYETLPFYLLIGMAVVGFCAGVYTYRVNQLKMRERTLLNLVNERTAALQESERQVRRSRDELEIRVHERTIELVRANNSLEGEILIRRRTEQQLRQAIEEAEQASRAKSDFLASVSHEIRSPVSGILGMAETLGARLEGEEKSYLDVMKFSARSLLNVVNSILSFSGGPNAAETLDIELFAIRVALESVTSVFSKRAEARGLSLITMIDSKLPDCVVGDRARLCQVLSALLDNAIKFTAEGGVTVSAALEAVEGGCATLHVSVADTGTGIAPEERERIFELITGSVNHLPKPDGTGLGLAISSQTAAMMGGRLWVESEPGAGSRFHFTARLGLASAIPASKEAVHA